MEPLRKKIKLEHPSMFGCDVNTQSGFYILNIKTKDTISFFVLEKLKTECKYNFNLFQKTAMSSKFYIESSCEYRIEAKDYNNNEQFEDPVATWMFFLPYGYIHRQTEIYYCREEDFNCLSCQELIQKYPQSYIKF